MKPFAYLQYRNTGRLTHYVWGVFLRSEKKNFFIAPHGKQLPVVRGLPLQCGDLLRPNRQFPY